MDKINHELLTHCFDESQFSRCALAEEMGVARETISNVLTGKNRPSYDVAIRLVHALKLTEEEVLTIFFPQIYRGKRSPSA